MTDLQYARQRLESHGVVVSETFYIGVTPWFLIEDDDEDCRQLSILATNRSVGTYLRRKERMGA